MEEDMDSTQELPNDSLSGAGTSGLSADLAEALLDSQNDVVVVGSQSQELVEMKMIAERNLQHVSDIEQRLNERDKFIEYLISKLSPRQKIVISEQWKRLQANQGLYFNFIIHR